MGKDNENGAYTFDKPKIGVNVRKRSPIKETAKEQPDKDLFKHLVAHVDEPNDEDEANDIRRLEVDKRLEP